ncbi:MAG TPA: YncE family protein [Actinomycetota bacterium]|nr:YncE family protein [Actinomycetota bacterium]
MRIRAGAVVTALAALLQPSAGNAAMTIVRTVSIAERGPAAIAFDPITNLAWVGSVTDDAINVFAGVHSVAKITQAGLNPTGIAIDALGQRALVTSYGSNKVLVYNTADRRKIASVDVAGGPWGVAVDPRDGTAYVATFAANVLTVVRRDNTTQQIALPGCGGAIGVAYSVPASRVLVSCIYSGTVHVLDGATLATVNVIDIGLGAYTWGIAASLRDAKVYAVNWSGGAVNTGTVTVIDASLAAAVATGFTGGAPIGVAVSPGGTPYVTLSATNELAILEPDSGLVGDRVALPVDPGDGQNQPHAVGVHPSGRYAIVGNFHAESVSFVAAAPHL